MIIFSTTGQGFTLFTDGSVTKIAAAASYAASTDTAKPSPNQIPTRGVTYKALVSTGAKDVAGNSLDQNSSTSLQHKV